MCLDLISVSLCLYIFFLVENKLLHDQTAASCRTAEDCFLKVVYPFSWVFDESPAQAWCRVLSIICSKVGNTQCNVFNRAVSTLRCPENTIPVHVEMWNKQADGMQWKSEYLSSQSSLLSKLQHCWHSWCLNETSTSLYFSLHDKNLFMKFCFNNSKQKALH